jgi:hypothetical protein
VDASSTGHRAGVPPTRTDGRDPGEGGGAAGIGTHRHGDSTPRGAAIPQLTREVIAPAADAASTGHRASVKGARTDGRDPGEGGGAAGIGTHRHGDSAPRGAAIPQLARGVVTPAADAPSTGHRASVAHTRTDSGDPGEGGGAAGIGTHRHGDSTPRGAAIPQLASAVGTPAADAPSTGHRASVEGARANGRDPSEGGGAAGIGTHRHGDSTPRGAAIPQLARGVVTPAADAPSTGHRASVAAARVDGSIDDSTLRVNGRRTEDEAQ